MNTRRIAGTVAGLGLTVVLCLSGCNGSSPATVSGADAKTALVSSLDALSTTTYAIAVTTARVSATGSVDPTGDVISVTAEGERAGKPATFSALTIEQASWAKINIGASGRAMGINPAKWLALDPTKLSAGSLPFDQSHPTDAFDLRTVMTGIISVKQVDSRHYTGSIDLTGLEGVVSFLPAGQTLGSAAKNVPFTATLDGQGRLTEFKVAGGSGEAYAFDFKISDYSAAALAQQPNDIDVVTAPSAAYTLLRTERFLTAN